MRRLLLCLWWVGGVFYAVSTLLLVDTVYFSGRRESQDARILSSTPSTNPPETAPIFQPEKLEEIAEATLPDSPAPDPSLARGLAITHAAVGDTEESSGSFEVSVFARETGQAERLKVRSTANIRGGPSSRAAIIGRAQAGAELEVASREAGWVRFVDPATSNAGWIHKGLLHPLTADSVPPTTERSVIASADESAKPKAKSHTRKVFRQVASRPAHKQKLGIRSSLSQYTELPSGFRPQKRGLGFFGRRQMLPRRFVSQRHGVEGYE